MKYFIFLLFPLALQAQTDCPAGLVANSFLGRCLTSEAASRVRQSENTCMQQSGAARNECFENAAAGEVARREESGELQKNVEGGKFAGNKTWSLVLNGLAIGASATVLINSQESANCKQAYSLYAIGGAGLVTAVGEIWNSVQYGGKLGDMKKKFKTLEEDSKTDSESGRPTATNIQTQAFQVMADQQELLGNIAESKKGWYTAAFVGYTAAAGLAAFEIASTAFGGSAFTECANLYANASELDDAPRGPVEEYLKSHFSSQKKMRYSQWLAQAELDRTYHFNPTNAQELLFQLATIYKMRAPGVNAMGLDEYEKYQRATAAMDGYGGGVKLLNQVVDLLIFSKAHAQANAAFETRRAGATGTRCDCERQNQTGTQITFNYQNCDFGQDDLRTCIGGGAAAGMIRGKGGVGTISSVDAMNGTYGQGSVATATKSRSDCAKYLGSVKCTVSTIPVETTRHLSRQLAETIVLKTLPIAPLSLAVMPPIPPLVLEQVTQTVKAVTTPAYGGVVKFLASPYTRLAMSGLMATYSKVTMDHYGKQKAVADNRRDYLLNMKIEIAASGEAFGCSNRSDLTNPNCYCYSDSGTLNPGRANSATCKHLFGAKPGAAKTNPRANAASNKGQACVSKTALDLTCSCRQTNSCMTVGLKASNLPSGLAESVGTAQGITNGLLNGSLDAVDISNFDSGAFAARMNQITDDLLKKNPQAQEKIKKAKDGITKLNTDLDRRLSSISGGKLNANSVPLGDFGDASFGDSKLAALGKMPDSAGLGKPAGTEYNGSALPTSSKAAATADAFDLGATTEPVVEAEVAPKFEDDNFQLNVADIHDKPEENIFDIVSHRYQKTGMRLLFDDRIPDPEPMPVDSAPAP